MTFIDHRPNVCIVRLELPWEIAEAIVKCWPQVIGAMQSALTDRQEDAQYAAIQAEQTQAQCESNVAMWKAQAQEFHAEVKRRSNRPGQKTAILKQIAAERGMKLSFIQQIMRVFPDES
jgi:isopenicillin N synthase-like dioxygenase